MNGTTTAQFISAGIQLYPQCGYKQLSEDALSRHLNTDPHAFHAFFESKDAFFKAMLVEYRERALGRISFDFSHGISEIERLRQLVWRLAVSIRSNLPWMHRMLMDSEEGIEIVRHALRIQNEIMALGLMEVMRACSDNRQISEMELLNQYDFLQNAVFMPMILNTRYQVLGLLTDDIALKAPELMTDAYIHQRIDWVLRALYPQAYCA